jgi:hypothetical protein
MTVIVNRFRKPIPGNGWGAIASVMPPEGPEIVRSMSRPTMRTVQRAFNPQLWRMKMTSKLNYALLGAALLVLSGYSAAQTPLEASTTDSVIVTGPRSTDSEIRAEVIKRIDENPALRNENIDVQSFDHNVYLYGSVTSRMGGEEADAIARTVSGVKNVYNGLGSFGA